MARSKETITLADRIEYDLKLISGEDGKGRMPITILVKSEAELKEGQAILKKSKHHNAKLISFRVET